MGRRRLDPTPSARYMMEILGTQVRQRRAELKITAADLGMRAGVGPRVVTALENGSPTVSLGNAIEIALAAGVMLLGRVAPILSVDSLLHIEKQMRCCPAGL